MQHRLNQFFQKSYAHLRKRLTKRNLLILLVLLVIFVIAWLIFKPSAKLPEAPTQSVVIAEAKHKDVPVFLNALGTVTPTYSVTVKTQVSGQLMQVLFTEGQMVKKGELIAEIDPRPYEAQLVQYQGQLARDTALLDNAKVDLNRYQTLWKQDSVAKQTLDTQVSLVRQDEGNVKLDEGLIQLTKVNLVYTKITSPIDGRVGLRLVDPGNFVQPSDATGIVVINMINPITVVFTLPEDDIHDVVKQINEGKKLVVYAYNRSQTKLLATGTLLTIDNQVDVTTGTVKLKAEFANDDNILFPSQFVNVKLLIATLSNATVVPTAAIQHGADNTFVYLLNVDHTKVKAMPVVIGVTNENDTVIKSGIKPGQFVVTEGADKLTDGASISVANPPEKVALANQSIEILRRYLV